MRDPKFGETVIVCETLQRVSRREDRVGKHGRPWRPRVKRWLRVPTSFRGIYIGYRYLSDGTTEFIDEAGWAYTPEDRYKAYLVVKDEKSKPVFCPVDSTTTVND
jgi:hypothetical protein